MTYEQLREIALRGGFVRWFPSKKVERLRLVKDFHPPHADLILAKRLIPDREHPIRPCVGQTEFYCIEVSPHELVQVGDMI
jgi:hypothetical protein